MKPAILALWFTGWLLFVVMDRLAGNLSMRGVIVRLLWPLFVTAYVVSLLETWAYREGDRK